MPRPQAYGSQSDHRVCAKFRAWVVAALRCFCPFFTRQVRLCRTPPVMIEQHVDDVFEELRLSGREEAIVNLVNGQLQFWKGLIVFFGLIPVAKGGWMRKEKGASVCDEWPTKRLIRCQIPRNTSIYTHGCRFQHRYNNTRS